MHELGRWSVRHAACSCAWGARMQHYQPTLRWYDDLPSAVEGLNADDLHLVAHRMATLDCRGMLEAAESISHPDLRQRIIPRIREAIERGRNAAYAAGDRES